MTVPTEFPWAEVLSAFDANERKHRRLRARAKMYAAAFFNGYIHCILWAETDNADESGGEPLDRNYCVTDFSSGSFELAEEDCARFVFENRHALKASGLTARRAGELFWLNRQGHGVGFWDCDLGEIGEKLSEAAKEAGERYVHVGSAGIVHVC